MERGRGERTNQNFHSNPSFGPCGNDNDYNNGNNAYNNRNNYEGRNNNRYRERFQNNRGPNNRGNYYQRRNDAYYNSYPYNQYNSYNPKTNYPEEESINEEKEKMEDEQKLKNKYESFIDKIENAFYEQISREDIFNIIKSLIKVPNLTIFEAINFIYREVKIYQSLEFYKIKKDKAEALDWDIYENKYPEEYPLVNLNKVIDSYKISKNDENNENKENSYYLYEDETKDKRRKITKNKEGIYNYLPIISIKNISQDDKKNFEDLEIFAKNENEINYHPLFFKTIMCHFCIQSENSYLINPLCPYSHDIQNDFRIIYDYKDKNICELMKALSDSKLFNFENYLKYIPKKLYFKKIDLSSFKVHKCLLDKSCPNDYHLCPYYHECEKERDSKRRPLFLFRYSSEICDYCFDKKKGKYIIKNCPYGDFCNCIHSKNEYNYHTNHFRIEFKCTRNKNGRCPFIKTCYGIHKENEDEKASEDEAEESEESIDEEKLEDDEINNIKEKIEKLVTISKNFRCRKCNSLKSDIAFSKNCEHFLCLTCFKKIKHNLKKSKKEENKKNKENKENKKNRDNKDNKDNIENDENKNNKENKDKKDNIDNKENKNEFKCPFCNEELVKGKMSMCLFSKN